MLVAEAFSRVLSPENPLHFEECHSLMELTPEQATEEREWMSGVVKHTSPQSKDGGASCPVENPKSKQDKRYEGTASTARRGKLDSGPVSTEIDPDEIVDPYNEDDSDDSTQQQLNHTTGSYSHRSESFYGA